MVYGRLAVSYAVSSISGLDPLCYLARPLASMSPWHPYHPSRCCRLKPRLLRRCGRRGRCFASWARSTRLLLIRVVCSCVCVAALFRPLGYPVLPLRHLKLTWAIIHARLPSTSTTVHASQRSHSHSRSNCHVLAFVSLFVLPRHPTRSRRWQDLEANNVSSAPAQDRKTRSTPPSGLREIGLTHIQCEYIPY